MKAVCHLKRGWCAAARAISIRPGAITADDLHSRMALEPFGKSVSLSVRQEINRSVAFQVDQYGPVPMTTAPRPIIYAENFHCGNRLSQALNKCAQNRVSA
jgi:hypothetical protein